MRALPLLGLLLAGTAPAAPLGGQVVPGPSGPEWLVRHQGGPVFVCGPGDPEGFLYRGTREANGTRSGDQAAIIAKLAASGANCLYLMAVRSHGGDGDASQNPFVDGDPTNDLDDDILDQWESWFTSLDDAGVVIHFFFYDDGARIWNTGDSVATDERAFVHALVDRFEHHRNLIWCVAEEYAEAYTSERVSAIAAQIRLADDHDHVIAVHQNHGLDFHFVDDPSIDQFAIQYNVSSAERLHSGMLSAWSGAAGRYQLNMAEAADFGTGAALRDKIWACALGGAYVMVLGMDVASTPVADLEACGRLVRFFEATSLAAMEPRDDLAAGDTDWVLADPPRAFIAYASSQSAPMGVSGVSEGLHDLRWLDCADGTTVVRTGVWLDAGTGAWTVPGGFGGQVALSVERTAATSTAAENRTGIKGLYAPR